MIEGIYFANPNYLWLLSIIPIMVVWNILTWKKQQPTLKMPSLLNFKTGSSFLAKLYPFLYVFRLLAISLIILSIARPQTVDVSTRTKTNKGIDIVMAIDVSSSMLAQDLKPNRLVALKRVAGEFIEDRRSDRIGLVVYAGESYTKTPITSDKSIVKSSLGEINFQGLIEDGTAIGMGLATSVNRLKDSKAKSKIIILLTDGVNNSGFIDPKIATELAVEFGIKTYTIGLGSNGTALAPVGILPNGKFKYGLTKVEIDEVLLKEISQKTGGIYFRATDNQKLEEIYDEINKLEKTEIEEFKYYNYEEKYRSLILLALALIVFEWILRSTVFKSFI
ncbi:MAG: aerotolerance regulator BatA [Flavobacteriaceae bacterium TMED68]|nr:MAG: aerotolerance regulator BatA [Flavobacteriaceae bacterium TMED68]|tara:strand:+ start:34813 stop:35817 length:1005 start_codon:yes stop_codon:yes gene_type:complete